MKKKAELFTADRLIEILENMGDEFGYKVDSDVDYDIENTATINYFGLRNKLFLSAVVLYGGIYTKINIFDKNGQNIFSKSVRAANFDIQEYRDVIDKVFQELGRNVRFLLDNPEKVYDYGKKYGWLGLEQEQYEILSKDISLSQKAVADMKNKGLEIPETLKKARRYSMGLKDIISSKIATEKIATKKVASAMKEINKKAAWSEKEKEQVGALDDNAVGKFNIYQDKAGEIFVTKHKLNDNFVLMDTAETFDDVQEKIEKDWQDTASYVGYDKELLNDKSIWQFADYEGDENGIVDLSKDYATEKKAAEEDLDVKLKVQKNKPAGLDTSSPKSLPESIRPLMQDLKGKISDVKEIETQLAARKAELDAKYQEAKNESKIVEKQAEIENLTNNIGKLLFAAKNETFQFQDNLVALTHQTKTVPAKATDKWKFEKVFAKLQELMGNDNAQKFLDATLNGLQSQATEKTITELNIFSPTQKQMKKSDTSDTNSFIDALKEIYTNLRSYFIDVKKANNILEEQLATGATASKKQVVFKKAKKVNKKAKMHKKAADNKVRIFLTNLGKYNEGELVGEWVDLPVQNFKPILDKIGIDGKNYEEVFITDYEAPFEIGEYENINELNNKVKRIETLDEEQKDVLYSVMGNWSEEDFDELFKMVEEREYFYVPQGNVNPEFYGTDATGPLDLAVGYIEQLGGVGALDEKTIDAYFDYNRYGEYLESMGFETTEKGYVQF